MKEKSIHFRINESFLERFEEALKYEGLTKTEVLTHAIQNFCVTVESRKMDDIRRQYEVSDHLQIRIDTHAKYEEKRVNLDKIVIEKLHLTKNEKILDIGCATGDFLIHLKESGYKGHLTGYDQSTKMIHEAIKNSKQKNLDIEWIVGDARKLPFTTNAYDWVVARHMLYHVPDVKNAIKGFKNVIKPDGGFIATTNSCFSLPRIQELCNNMLTEFGFSERTSPANPFCIENAKEILSSAFDNIDEVIISNALIFHHAEPIVKYITSMFPSLDIPDDKGLYLDMQKWLQVETENIISNIGVWQDSKNVGIYRCN
ncbi:methyltransferase [Bacillus sp. FJAT-25509]|uniref:class I SAM-dependent methyltransferase n=1 Tax=Bacillus sp. FJAT-25509 TaxID=1712029 RepID=UPI0006FCE79B|nr:class I SAM-dependent methyltransferase [Bacillus sp. FJAT-25509]KQL35444.1 methyltransferase [Bacillus sp. FJAT-25509]